jgi:hypothetical protein
MTALAASARMGASMFYAVAFVMLSAGFILVVGYVGRDAHRDRSRHDDV